MVMRADGFQIITQQGGKFIGRWRLFLLFAIFCMTMNNSLIINFVTQKVGLCEVHLSAVLCERKQGEKRYCLDYRTSDNQRFCGSIQLQTEHSQRPMGCER